ncbi:MAG: methionyl-tRNA formyltransferase [Gammaproteobacteria bacterium]|nr:methionyl-tRNA formyltransferase [Gammaproteobacteria bacterium]
MRIVIHGQQAFGRAVLEKLLARDAADEQIIAVCTAPEQPGKPDDPLKALALEHDLPVHQPASWKTPEALALMQSFNADVCMMAYVLLFVPETVLNAPRLGSFQYHPSLLPMHRGPSSINWPIALGATETGLSIFWPNDGLDEGPILLQKTCAIGADETLGDVYFNKLFPLGVDAMLESLDLVKAGDAPRIAQDLTAGSYESWFGKAQAEVDWTQPAQTVYNIIRAANPQPGAWTTHAGARLSIFDSELIAGGDGAGDGGDGAGAGAGKPGEVLTVDDNGITVAAADGAIRIKRVRADAGKIPAAEYAAAANLKPGDQLG